MRRVDVHDLGMRDYEEVWQLQKSIFNRSVNEKLEGKKPEMHLILCEHPHVYTLGKSAQHTNLLLSESELKERQIGVYDIERGGDITYHGPGQLVVYPIFDLEQLNKGVKQFVEGIEQCIIQLLKRYEIQAERIQGRIGLWIGKNSLEERKIAAIGIKCSRHISMHGLALNVNTDLSLFGHIIPCGIPDKGVSSIQHELGREIQMSDVKSKILEEFSHIFDLQYNRI